MNSLICEHRCWLSPVPPCLCASRAWVRGCGLRQDLQPPKQLYVEVHVLEDYGDIMTSSGSVMLKKDEYLLLKRSDVEHLIRQGVLAETAV